MKKYYIDITIGNDLGELLDRRLSFTSLEEMGNAMGDKMFKMVDEANDYAKENNMIVEEIFDSKEEAEFNKEDVYDGSSNIDLINSDEKFQ